MWNGGDGRGGCDGEDSPEPLRKEGCRTSLQIVQLKRFQTPLFCPSASSMNRDMFNVPFGRCGAGDSEGTPVEGVITCQSFR